MMDPYDSCWVLPSSQSRLTGADAERFERLRTERRQGIDRLLRGERERAIATLFASARTYFAGGPG